MPPYLLCKHETIGEVVFVIDRTSDCSLSDELVDIPLPVPLKYTFALNTMLGENSIQARLGGDRLITTVEDLNEVITNGGNVVAEQIHFRLVSFRIESNRSVARLPVQVVRNGIVHFPFDLTHEKWSCLT